MGLTCREDCIVGRVCNLHHTLQTVQTASPLHCKPQQQCGVHMHMVQLWMPNLPPRRAQCCFTHKESSICHTLAFVLALYRLQADDKQFTPHALFVHQG